MNPLDARESEETYEYPARPYTLPMRPVQSFRVLSESGDVFRANEDAIEVWAADWAEPDTEDVVFYDRDIDDPWADKYLTAEDARVLRQDGM